MRPGASTTGGAAGKCTATASEPGAATSRRRGGIDARDLPARRGAPCIPEDGRRLDRAAALAQFFPLATATEVFAQGTGAPEKKDLKVGFIPITCATPIIMAHPMGFYSKQGLNVEVVKTAGWAVVRDKTINKEYDAAHMLSPMPLAISLGLGSQAIPFAVPAIENINGQGITLAVKHKDKRDPKQWRGFNFAIPFDYSMHNYLLRYYLAEHGVDPDADVQLRVVPPPEMVANLRADNIDGFLAPDNVCQRAIYDGVGFLHILSKEIWDGHPCCSFTASKEFITQMPNSYAALVRAIVDATAFASKAENRKQIAETIAPANYLNQPPIVVEQALTGTYADGLGGVRDGPQAGRFRSVPVAILRGLDADPDEAVGTDQGRCRLPGHRRAGFPGHRHGQTDAGDGSHAAREHIQALRRDGKDLRPLQARRLCAGLLDQAVLIGSDSFGRRDRARACSGGGCGADLCGDRRYKYRPRSVRE